MVKTKDKFITVLQDFLECNATTLNYDGRQFYSQLYSYLEMHKDELNLEANDTKLSEVYELTKNPPVLSLVPLKIVKTIEDSSEGGSYKEKFIDLIVRLNETNRFVVSVSTKNEEICVWDAVK